MKQKGEKISSRLSPAAYIIPLLILGLISVFFAVSSIYQTGQIERSGFLTEIHKITEEAKLELQIDIVKAFDSVLTLSRNQALIRWFDGSYRGPEPELALNALEILTEDNRFDTAFAASTREEIYYLSGGISNPLSPMNSDDSWFYDSLSMEKEAEINIDHNSDIDKTMLWVNVKVRNKEGVIGVAGLGMNLERIQNKLAAIVPGDRGSILFADELGRVRLAYPPEMFNRNLSEILNDPSKSFYDISKNTLSPIKRNQTVYTVSKIPDLNLTMVITIPMEDFISPFFTLTRSYSLLSIALIVLLLTVFLAIFQRLRTTILYQNKSQDMTIHSMSMLAELKDNETGAHIFRTRQYCRLLSEELSRSPRYRKYLTPTYIDDLERSAPLHDIGKVGIPDSILLKPDKLTEEEFEIIKSHTEMGAKVLNDAMNSYQFRSYFTIGVQLVRHHHEKWDGSGYPDGLAKDKIPLSARIMAIADVYDALRSVRPYKKAFSHEKALSIIKEGSATHFEPELVEAFLRMEKEFRKISLEYSD